MEKPTQASSLGGGEMDTSWSPELLLYSSTEELQTLATLKLRVAMLDQQIHLEKVLPEQEVVMYTWVPRRCIPGFQGANDLTEAGT